MYTQTPTLKIRSVEICDSTDQRSTCWKKKFPIKNNDSRIYSLFKLCENVWKKIQHRKRCD